MSEDITSRLIRIETRLVKYQESNVQQLMGIHDAIEHLCEALNLLTDTQPEEGANDE